MGAEPGEERAEHSDGASGTLRTTHATATTVPQTPGEYEAVWYVWERAGPPEEATDRADAIQKMRDCLIKGNTVLNLIASWLTQLAEDDELRAKSLAMATEAASSCEDRVILALNQMWSVLLVRKAEKGEYDNNIPGLISVGREIFRMDVLGILPGRRSAGDASLMKLRSGWPVRTN